MNRSLRGFTLVELIIVIIVIAVLATVAVPQYFKAVSRAKVAKAQHAISLIAQAEKMYRAEMDVYIAAASPTLATTFVKQVDLKDVDMDESWGYAATITPTDFTITATGSGTAGPMKDLTVIYNSSTGKWTGTAITATQ